MVLQTHQVLIVIVMITLGTMITRFLPFILFPIHKQVPKYIQYLGETLPYAMIGLLVIYCMKDITWNKYPFGIPELIAVFFTGGLHAWKHHTLLSIIAGTGLYMVLVQTFFVVS